MSTGAEVTRSGITFPSGIQPHSDIFDIAEGFELILFHASTGGILVPLSCPVRGVLGEVGGGPMVCVIGNIYPLATERPREANYFGAA